MATRRVSSAVLVSLLLLFVGLSIPAVSGSAIPQSDVTVHEWGTFTTVAGTDGLAMQWTPLGGPTDLPCFVYRYRNGDIKGFGPDYQPYNYEAARTQLPGTVRMETPVLYFYADRPARLSVSVGFQQGLFSERYPNAAVLQSTVYRSVLSNPQLRSRMSWNDVEVRPGTSPTLLREQGSSHYYAARDVDAAPIRVNGQDEAFLFYRGVGGYGVPIATTLREDGSIAVRNLGQAPLHGVIVFTKQDGRIGYRVQGTIERDATIAAPVLDGTFAALRSKLEKTLTAQGLFAKEAAAMVETWRDSWFEDGTRVLYILPVPAVDAVLPLSITPAPARVARVFVGRSEIITPTMVAAVQYALAEADEAMLARYGRFLGPIGERLIATARDAAEAQRIRGVMNAALANYAAKLKGCG